MSKHTPGPWKAHLSQFPGHIVKVDNSAQQPVAALWEGGVLKSEQIANAHLIAAAPELYEALKEMYRNYKRDATACKLMVCLHVKYAFDLADLALEKAEGGVS